MKKFSLVLIALFALMELNAQQDSTTKASSDSTSIAESVSDSTDIDTTRMTFGKTKVIIITDNNYEESEEKKDENDTIVISKREQRYNHYAGVDFGVNGFANPDMGLGLQKEAEFLDLDYGRSFSFSFNLFETYIPIYQEKFGISTGLGFEFNKYSLDRDIVIYTDKDTTYGFQDSTRSIQKNLLKTEMLNVPIFFETNLGRDAEHSFHLAAGAMVSYRLGSKTKQIYRQNGTKHKAKDRNDFNMNPFRFSLVARIGYSNFTMFLAYSMTEMFESNDGPEVYPFTVGISLVTF